MTQPSNEEQPVLPSWEDFYLRTPIYEFFPISEADRAAIQQIQYPMTTLDAYCIECGRVSIFRRESPQQQAYLDEDDVVKDRGFIITFICNRNYNHRLKFWVTVVARTIGKVGQLPSLADLHSAGILKYRKALGDERYRELNRAIGLAAHGVGIGSFVYLRRVFESLIEEARRAAGTAVDEAAYQRARMDEKILLLKAFLPSFLVENRSLYGILSTGIHSLTEAACISHFDTVRAGIEFILDERIEQQEREEKLSLATKAITKLRGKLKS